MYTQLKKLTSLMLAVMMLIGVIPTTVFAEDTWPEPYLSTEPQSTTTASFAQEDEMGSQASTFSVMGRNVTLDNENPTATISLTYGGSGYLRIGNGQYDNGYYQEGVVVIAFDPEYVGDKSWSVSCPAYWCRMTNRSGVGDGSFSFRVYDFDGEDGIDERNTTITVEQADGHVLLINIRQVSYSIKESVIVLDVPVEGYTVSAQAGRLMGLFRYGDDSPLVWHSDAEWCVISDEFGAGYSSLQRSFYVDYETNTHPIEARKATITVSSINGEESQSFTITQQGMGLPYLQACFYSVASTAMSLKALNARQWIQVDSNQEWEINCPAEWVHLKKDSRDPSLVHLSCDDNKGYLSRDAVVVVSAPNCDPCYLFVTQEASGYYYWTMNSAGAKVIDVSSDAQSFYLPAVWRYEDLEFDVADDWFNVYIHPDDQQEDYVNVYCVVSENISNEVRESNVTYVDSLYRYGIKIRQAASEPKLSIVKNRLLGDATKQAGGVSYPLFVESNREWTVVSDVEWCVPTIESNENNEFFTVTTQPNTTDALRKAILTISAPGCENVCVYLTQACESFGACNHPVDQQYVDSIPDKTIEPQYQDTGDGVMHYVIYSYAKYCGVCKERIGTVQDELQSAATEPHDYDEAGVCICGATNAPAPGIPASPIPVQSQMTVNRGEPVTISWYASEGAERYGVWFYDTDPGTYVDAGSSLSVTHVFEHNNPKDAPFAVQIYALAGNGENQKQSEPATVLVTVGCEDGKHDFTGATVYDRTLYKEIPGDHEFHLAYADVYKQTCIECGMGGFETTVERDAAQQEKEKHSYVDGICQVEGCKHVCAHQFEYKLENGLNVPVENSGRWVMVDENYCKKLVRYWEQCTYCGLEREGTTEHEDGSVSKHIIGTIESYTPLAEDDPDYTTKHLWTTTYQPCANKCGYDPQKAPKTERRAHTIVDGKCVECGYVNEVPLKKAGFFSFWPSMDFGKSLVYFYDYDEQLFFEDSTVYQHDLVKMSVRVAMAAYGTGKSHDGTNIKKLMEDELLFNDVKTVYPTPSVHTIGYSFGHKNITSNSGERCTLIMAAVRGGNYADEWGGNFAIGTGRDHEGFATAAKTVFGALCDYIEEHRSEMKGDIKIWISGYSRGAATTNLVAKMLNDLDDKESGISNDNIFAFCFECPQNTKDPQRSDSKYDNIKNFVNPVDFVPKVAMSDWGFGRYGKTYYTPYMLAKGDKDYQALEANMKKEYSNLITFNEGTFGSHSVDEYIPRGPGWDIIFDDIMSALASRMTNQINYATYFEAGLVEFAVSTFGEGTCPITNENNTWDNFLNFAAWDGFVQDVIGELVAGCVINGLNPLDFAETHYAELCMAWLDSLEGEFSYADPTYRILYVNCPVDIKVYDSSNSLVGSISGDVPSEIEHGIVAYVDYNGQKMIALPNNEEYTIQITATDNGTVTYTATEYNIDTGKNEKVISYFEVPVVAGEMLTGIAENIGSTGSGTYPLYQNGDSTALTPSLIQSGNSVIAYQVTVSSVGNGQAVGGGLYAGGEFARVIATPDADELFYGWYVDDVLVSSDIEYRFLVKEDTHIEARFTVMSDPIIPPQTGDDTPLEFYWLLCITSAFAIMICLYIMTKHRVRKQV